MAKGSIVISSVEGPGAKTLVHTLEGLPKIRPRRDEEMRAGGVTTGGRIESRTQVRCQLMDHLSSATGVCRLLSSFTEL
jgi:hypothetical protein